MIIVVVIVIMVLEFVTISNRERGELEEEVKWIVYNHMNLNEYELRSWYEFILLSYGYVYFYRLSGFQFGRHKQHEF